jgi:VWFA-related protein
MWWSCRGEAWTEVTEGAEVLKVQDVLKVLVLTVRKVLVLTVPRVLVLTVLMVLPVTGAQRGAGATGQRPTAGQQPAQGQQPNAGQRQSPEQQPAQGQQPTFKSSIDLVQVDVVVVDKDGNPVRGLDQAAFTVKDRGKAQTIATFEEIGHETRAEQADLPALPPAVGVDVANNQSAQSDRLVVMVVDDLHIWKGRTERAKQIARDVVTRFGAESSMAVLFTSGQHNTSVTTDRAALLSAVDTLQARQSVKRPHPAVDNQRVPHVDPEDDATGRGGTLDKMSAAGLVTVQDFSDNMQQYGTLQNAAKMLGTEDVRRKAFVLLSEGIGKDLTGLFGDILPGEVPAGGEAYVSGNITAFAAASAATVPPYHTLKILEMMEALRRANVATYAIDPRGEVKPGDLLSECFPAPAPGDDPCAGEAGGGGPGDWMSIVRQAQHGLDETAVATGGFAITNSNDFTGGLSRILEDLDHYYLLGFYPSDPGGKGYRPLNVLVAGHPDWTLRYRRGYMGGPKPEPPKNADPMVGLSAGVLPNQDLPLRLNAIALPGTGNQARVVLAMEVSAPVKELQSPDGKIHDQLKYEVLLVDDKKAKVRSVGGLEGNITLSPAHPGQPAPETVTYQVTHMIDVPPGKFEFRVSADSAKLAKGGSVYLAVDVPAFHTAATALGTIAIGYAGGARVPVAPTVTTVNGRGNQAAPAAARLPLPFAPTLDRVFASSDVLRVYVEGTARATAGLTAMIDIVNPDGTGVASFTPVLNGQDPIAIGGDVSLQALRPGPYLMRVTLTGGGQKAVRETGFAVR